MQSAMGRVKVPYTPWKTFLCPEQSTAMKEVAKYLLNDYGRRIMQFEDSGGRCFLADKVLRFRREISILSILFFFFLEMRQCVIFLKTLQCKASVKESGSSNTNYTSNQVMDLTPPVRLHLQARPGYSRQISQKPQPILWGPFTDIVHWIYISRHDD